MAGPPDALSTPPRTGGLAGSPRGCYRVGVFGIGTTELIVVALLALMLFSPRELPKIIRSISQFWGSIRRTADEFKDVENKRDKLSEQSA